MAKKRSEIRDADVGDLICPFIVAGLVASGKALEGGAECWLERCQMWEANKATCGLKN